jgi:hypothetical protein
VLPAHDLRWYQRPKADKTIPRQKLEQEDDNVGCNN